MSDNIHPVFEKMLSREERQNKLNQKSCVLWFTGLSGSGKSTIAVNLERLLFQSGFFAQVLDGDNIRFGLNKNLGFSTEDREENIRRISEVAKLYCDSGIITICSFVSPTAEIRNQAKSIIGENDFYEIFVDTPLEVCENRDVKGLYKKARKGEIQNFTGIDAPYEKPKNPDLTIETDSQSILESTEIVFNYIHERIKLV